MQLGRRGFTLAPAVNRSTYPGLGRFVTRRARIDWKTWQTCSQHRKNCLKN
jgi:hypothetical protein